MMPGTGVPGRPPGKAFGGSQELAESKAPSGVRGAAWVLECACATRGPAAPETMSAVTSLGNEKPAVLQSECRPTGDDP